PLRMRARRSRGARSHRECHPPRRSTRTYLSTQPLPLSEGYILQTMCQYSLVATHVECECSEVPVRTGYSPAQERIRERETRHSQGYALWPTTKLVGQPL